MTCLIGLKWPCVVDGTFKSNCCHFYLYLKDNVVFSVIQSLYFLCLEQGTAEVNIVVGDTNEPPQFSNSTYVFHVTEGNIPTEKKK